ncbi:MAG: ROK family protein [Planctomycetota bacterium]|nr:ROK family protein [Planctomycetota bacterium]
MILALDIGASSFKWTLQDPTKTSQTQFFSQDFHGPRPSPKALFQDIREAVSGAPFEDLRICVPGPVRDGVLRRSLNLGWYDVSLSQWTQDIFHREPTVVMSDVEATLACAQEELGQAENVLALVLGTGLGVGALIDGQRYAGKIHGHISSPAGKACGCGLDDCLEGRVGWRGMVNAARELGLTVKNGRELSKQAKLGSEEAQGLLLETGDLIAEACLLWVERLQTPVKIWLAGGPSADTYLRMGVSRTLHPMKVCFSSEPRYAGLRGLLSLSS